MADFVHRRKPAYIWWIIKNKRCASLKISTQTSELPFSCHLCQLCVGTFHLCTLNWIVSRPGELSFFCTSVGTPSTRRACIGKSRGQYISTYLTAKNNRFDIFVKILENMVHTSFVEAHHACAIVMMSPQGLRGSPYLPERKRLVQITGKFHFLVGTIFTLIHLPSPECSTEE